MQNRENAARLEGLAPEGRRLFAQWPVRLRKAQKAGFRADVQQVLQDWGWQMQTEQSGRLIKNHNVVAGDVQSA